ncbi:MAG: class II aldolase/adducin family protein [Firmicutes bacterium]|nr:class II aldolase/adducin family protein [Bacillota bacterium]MCL5040695.1 class II aldolase/adducin family protein [Bacillota bacterium]
MNLEDLKKELVAISRLAYHRGLTSGVSGNISQRVPGHDQVLIKRSGTSFADAQTSDFLLVALTGELLAGSGTPSVEINFHLGIYRERPDVGAVLHGHSTFATAFAVAGKTLPALTLASAEGLGEVPLVPYAPAGSQELAALVVQAFRSSNIKAALLRRHGMVTVGKDLRQAFYLADLVEDTAKVALLARLIS